MISNLLKYFSGEKNNKRSKSPNPPLSYSEPNKLHSYNEKDLYLYKKIMELPKEFRCVKTTSGKFDLDMGQVMLGVKKSEMNLRQEILEITGRPKEIGFYLGANNYEIFDAYVASTFPEEAQELFVGHPTYDYCNDNKNMNENIEYSEVINILSKASFPNLKKLRIGVTELFCNSGGLNGSVGDVTDLLKKMPNLEILEIGGHFELTEK
ncbi:MAG: hypothetical protein MJK11_09825, partial [Pseudomonadales bacterium]|nr:hypothetical protein [Pseudomonadales bacterium]